MRVAPEAPATPGNNHCPRPCHGCCVHVSKLRVDPSHGVELNLPALRLFADVIQDAVDLVQGTRHANSTTPSKPSDVAAARDWIRDGNVGLLTFNEACGWLGLDAEQARQAIFSPRGA